MGLKFIGYHGRGNTDGYALGCSSLEGKRGSYNVLSPLFVLANKINEQF